MNGRLRVAQRNGETDLTVQRGGSMRRFVPALAVSMGLMAAWPGGAAADLVSGTQATLTCNDGHSVVMVLDQSGLTNLLAEVQAVNTAGTLSCSVATDPPSESAKWTVYDYNPSNQAIAPRNSPNSLPATTNGSTTTFRFKSGIYTALLTTIDKSLVGDLSGKTLNDTVSLSGPATTFISQNGDGCGPSATVRFYFRSPSASGSSVGNPPAGFYTQYWWSNPVFVPLLAGNQGPTPISADMSDPAEWSDWNGQSGANPAVTEAFIEATQKVQAVGLSFGGGCFFENGVTALNNPNNTEQFSSTFTESP
jgi:hypothetical protein